MKNENLLEMLNIDKIVMADYITEEENDYEILDHMLNDYFNGAEGVLEDLDGMLTSILYAAENEKTEELKNFNENLCLTYATSFDLEEYNISEVKVYFKMIKEKNNVLENIVRINSIEF